MKACCLKAFVFLVVVSACSSPQKIEVKSSAADSIQSVMIYRKDESSALQNAARGTLPFFYGGSKGVNLLGVKFNEPVTSENPGVDCDLNYVEGKSPSHSFRCIVREGQAHIIVTLQEDLIEGRRLLRRVFVDGKGEELINQWASALGRIGYQKVDARVAGVTTRYVSRANGNIADVLWVAATKSATLRISPKM